MEKMKNNGVSYVILFIIFLVIITVFAWKACSEPLETAGFHELDQIQNFYVQSYLH